MEIELDKLYTTQSSAKRSHQIKDIIASIKDGDYIEPIHLSEIEDGVYRIEDGTHRAIAYYLSGKKELGYGEYEIVPFNPNRNTIMPLPKLVDLVTLFGDAK